MTYPFRTDHPEPQRPTLMATRHAVVANHPWASQAAFEILEAGGNAIDAGVAGGLALNVLESDMCHFLGVAPTMLYVDGEVVTAVGPGPWPKAATLDYFWEKHDGIVPRGILHSVVPSAPDTWITLLERYGTMSFGEVAQAAIRFARDGFPMFFLRRDRTLEMYESGLHYACPSTDALFAPGGRVPQIGEIFRQPAQAAMLQYVSDQEKAAKGGRAAGLKAARDAVYRGDVARALVRMQEQLGGLVTMADLDAYTVEIEPAIKGRFGDWDMFVCGPWSQGPMVLEALNLLKRFDLASFGHNSVEHIHVVAEALKLAAADREAYFGDPKFETVPLDTLLSEAYAESRSRRIDMSKAHPEMPLPGEVPGRSVKPWQPDPSAAIGPPTRRQREPVAAETSYICVVDKHGNAFSSTPSDAGVMGPVVPELGLPCCAWGSRAYTGRDHPARIGPGRRPRMAANPQIAIRPDRTVMPFGSPGSEVLGQAQLQAFLNTAVFEMEPQLAVEAPRFASYSWPNSMLPHSYHPGRLQLEGRIDKGVAATLASMGHKIDWWPDRRWRAGSVGMIHSDLKGGVLYAGADHRRQAYATGW
jgi:gamma-glutamyltranspeptidase/glutathione hydrolase